MSTRAHAKRKTEEHHHHHHHHHHHSSDESLDAAAEQQLEAAEGIEPVPMVIVNNNKRSKSERSAATTEPFPAHLDPNDPAHFDHFLFQLLSFRVTHGSFSANREKHPALHTWLQTLKREYKTYTASKNNNSDNSHTNKSRLTDQQVAVLEFYHVPLTSRGDDHWTRFYHLLRDYKERHGHCVVPRLCEIPGLGDWVTDQRRQRKLKSQGQQTSLSDEREELLNELGFVWKVRNRPEWDKRYEELLLYKEQNGDCKVPQHYNANRALGKWVAKQREQYRLLQKGQHSFLTPYRLEKLNECGFCWAARASAKDAVAVAQQHAQQQQQQQAAAAAATAAAHHGHESMQEFPQVKDQQHPHQEPTAEDEAAVDEALGGVSKEDFALRDDSVDV